MRAIQLIEERSQSVTLSSEFSVYRTVPPADERGDCFGPVVSNPSRRVEA